MPTIGVPFGGTITSHSVPAGIVPIPVRACIISSLSLTTKPSPMAHESNFSVPVCSGLGACCGCASGAVIPFGTFTDPFVCGFVAVGPMGVVKFPSRLYKKVCADAKASSDLFKVHTCEVHVGSRISNQGAQGPPVTVTAQSRKPAPSVGARMSLTLF